MPYTIQDYNQRMAAVTALDPAASQRLLPLTTSYAAHAAHPKGPLDPFCEGVLLTLDALTAAPQNWFPGAVPLLAALAQTSWQDLILGDAVTFFHTVSHLKARPNKLQEIHGLLRLLSGLLPVLEPEFGLSSVLDSATHLLALDISSDPELFLPRLPRLARTIEVCRGRTGEQYVISATGSDWHLDGRQVLFLHHGTQSRLVYKPRPLDSDFAFYELIKYFNELLARNMKPYPLPTPGAPRLTPDWGIETFIGRVDHPLTAAEASKYYTQMGYLFFLTKLLGMADAHQDNVIPTPGGPVLIDAECGFQLHTMLAHSLGATSLPAALSDGSSPKGPDTASALFQVGDEPSTTAFARFGQEILDGFACARRLLTADLPALYRLIRTLWSGVSYVRVLPTGTKELADLILDAVGDRPEADFLAHPDVVKIIDWLDTCLPTDVNIDRHALFQGMTYAMGRLEIPYFSFRREDGTWRLYSENRILAQAGPFDRIDLEDSIAGNLIFLRSPSPVEELEALIAQAQRGC